MIMCYETEAKDACPGKSPHPHQLMILVEDMEIKTQHCFCIAVYS